MFNVFLTIFLFVSLFITWAFIAVIYHQLTEEANKNDIFRKGMCQLHADMEKERAKNMDLILKNFNALLDNADFENHRLDSISELLVTKPATDSVKKKPGRKKKAKTEDIDIPEETATASREDLEKL